MNKEYEDLVSNLVSKNMYFDRAYSSDITMLLDDIIFQGEAADLQKKSLFHGSRGIPSVFNLDSWEETDEGKSSADIRPHADYIHGVLGIASEVGELAEALQKSVFKGTVEVDKINLKEEVGDILWYATLLAQYAGFTVEDCFKANYAKLESRYEGGFSATKCLERDVEVEREILTNA